jgi:GT2 family glycosyltransferase
VTSPTISVVIVNWNSRDDVLAGIESLGPAADLEIVVVDNGSTDDSVATIRRRYPQVKLVLAGKNLGFAEGCNRGIEATQSEWVFLLNNDAAVAPDCVAQLRGAAGGAPPDVGMIQACLVFRHRPDRVNSSGVVVFTNGAARDRHFAEPVAAASEPAEVFCSTAGAALYRRTMLEQVRTGVGYFDRRFFMYFEDVDLGWRCRLAGWRAVYLPGALVLHRFQGSSTRHGRNFAKRYCQINRVHTLVKNASLSMLVRTVPRTISDLVGLTLNGSPGALWQLARHLGGSVRERRRITRMTRIDRAELEEQWIRTREFRAPRLELPVALD